MRDMKKCIDCDAEFERSRTDSTVRCPACRATRRHTPRSAETPISTREIFALSAAYAARREFGYDSDEAREALALYLRVKS